MRYVVGLIFSEDWQTLLLIRKSRPWWQAQLLNGVGGKVEDAESPIMAMVRECQEETALRIPALAWQHALTCMGVSYEIHYFYAVTDALHGAESLTDEPVELIRLDTLMTQQLVPDLRWIIPFCVQPQIKLPVTIERA